MLRMADWRLRRRLVLVLFGVLCRHWRGRHGECCDHN